MVNFVVDSFDISAALTVLPNIIGDDISFSIDAAGKSFLRVERSKLDNIFYFWFENNGSNFGDSVDDVWSAINIDEFPDLSFSKALVDITGTDISHAPGVTPNSNHNFASNKTGWGIIGHDLLRWWAYDIFGTANSVDLITNEDELLDDITAADVSLNHTIKNIHIPTICNLELFHAIWMFFVRPGQRILKTKLSPASATGGVFYAR